MGLFHKKDNKVILNKDAKIKFTIPQIDETYGGLIKERPRFESSIFSSSLFGTGVKDDPSFVDGAGQVDVTRQYDSFRAPGEKKLTDEEMIKRYGSKFPEFDKISNHTAEEVYGEKITINKKPVEKKEQVISTFSFIKSAKDIDKKEEEPILNIKPEVKEEVKSNNAFDFGNTSDLDLSDLNEFKPRIDSLDVSDEEAFFKESPEDGKTIVDKYGNLSSASSSIIRKNRNQNNSNPFRDRLFGKKEVKEEIKVETSFEEPIIKNDNIEIKVQEEVKEEPVIRTQVNKENASSFKFNFSNNEPKEMDDNDILEAETPIIIPTIVNPYRDYKFPPTSLFKKTSEEDNEIPEWVYTKQEVINNTLKDFDIAGTVSSFVKGPTFVRYEITLNTGVNVKRITQIEDNLLMNLEVKSIRIQAPIPGKRTVGIEVPNQKRETVWFGDLITDEYLNDGKPLNLLLGKDIDGNVISTNVAKWPHGLVAGGTGSGKSVCINSMLISLLLKNKPDDVKLLIVDPKMVEFLSYNDLPHLITPVISDPEMASKALKWACDEMDRRYQAFTQAGGLCKDIVGYNELSKENPLLQKMPYILIIIDELADLMQTCSQDVDQSIKRITAKARAAGIHLLLATQRPTTDVVSGTIKANVQARVAMRVSSSTDSMVILGETGAESLLGNGDMLLKEVDNPVRLQGSFITEKEIYEACEFIKNQYQPDYLFTHDDLTKKFTENTFGRPSSSTEDPNILYEAALYCIENKSCSVNSLQQQLQIGFNRSRSIVDTLEEMGIVSGQNSTKKRDILITREELNEMFGRYDD